MTPRLMGTRSFCGSFKKDAYVLTEMLLDCFVLLHEVIALMNFNGPSVVGLK